jgi:hypothetical protein
LVLHAAMLDAQAREHLQTLTGRHDVLRAVIDFRDRLQAIWNGSHSAEKQMVQQLRDLCSFASNSDIAALRDFAARLQRYRPLLTSFRPPRPLATFDTEQTGRLHLLS